MKDKHGLKLLPEDQVYEQRGELFDNSQFDRINKVMTRWTNSFKAVNRKFEMQRSFREGKKVLMPLLPFALLTYKLAHT